MESNQNQVVNPHDKVSLNKNFFHIDTVQKLNYFYPNGFRIANQLRWFKSSRDRSLKTDKTI